MRFFGIWKYFPSRRAVTVLYIIVIATIIALTYYLKTAFKTSLLEAPTLEYLDNNEASSDCPTLSTKPLCTHGILQRERRPGLNTPILLTSGPEDPYQIHRDCRLHHYDYAAVTTCIDGLSYRRAQHKEPVHIAFIGESILRHQFMSFLKWIPDYDMHMKRSPTPRAQYVWHEDRDVTSEALNLKMSFYWRPLANEELIKTFSEWNTPPYHSTPDYIITGMILNHMDERNGNNYAPFVKGLKQLKPILEELSNVTRVVWMQQAPIVDASNTKHYITHSFLAKVHRYNTGMREILEGSGVDIWDSIDPVAMQYVQSCSLLERSDNHIWHHCFDAIHTGYVTLEHSGQVLLNDMCNRVILPS